MSLPEPAFRKHADSGRFTPIVDEIADPQKRRHKTYVRILCMSNVQMFRVCLGLSRVCLGFFRICLWFLGSFIHMFKVSCFGHTDLSTLELRGARMRGCVLAALAALRGGSAYA